MTELTGAMFIGFKRVHGTAGSEHSRDASTGAPIGPAYGMDDGSATDAATRLAADAFDAYRSRPAADRAAFLRAIADRLAEQEDAFAELVVAETALPEARARGELARTTGQLRLFAALLDEPGWEDRRHVPGSPDLHARRIPLGPVAVFGASNFPLAFSVAGGDTASALAAGCPVVVKAHPAHLQTGELAAACVAEAAAETGMPDGTFSLVYGAGNEIGTRLVAAPPIAAVGFTGSRSGGLALMAVAQARPVPIPVYAEMSSVNPVFLLPGRLAAAPAQLAEAFVASLTAGAGQFCTNPGLLLAVDGPGLAEFRAALAALLEDKPPATMLTPAIGTAYQSALRARAEHLIAGAADACTPAVFAATAARFGRDPLLREEVFGAASLLVTCADADELVALAESLEGQLTATLHAEPADHPLARRLLPVLERRAGRIIYNGWPTGVEVNAAMVHGGPFPATSDGRSTSVGTMAIERFLRPVAYQDLPPDLLP
ncbi:aldehyde dehydrogenase (NADP(+)) [Dactylosporangium sp. NPDC000244]|uniref:aldehyde dehydrogenase (NADP(+)) n=1 Tax=Dactylosporangium sp. NPDC000244 TaxID=3154365 RepID=UPI00332A233A